MFYILFSDVKVVVIGDGNVGKTCLLISFCTNSFPSDVAPTVFDSHVTEIEVDGQVMRRVFASICLLVTRY